MPDVGPDKVALAARWRLHLEGTLASLERTLGSARSAMDVVGDRPDSRGERADVTSQGYLADGLARRIEDVRTALALLDEVDAGPCERGRTGALMTVVEEDEAVRHVIVLPGGDGTRLEDGLLVVTVLAPTSPWARALRGLEAGDEARVDRATGPITIRVVAVA